MAWLKAFLLGIGALAQVIARMLTDAKVKREQVDAQSSADRIDADPGAEWVRRFREQRDGTGAASSQADTGKPDADK